MSQATGLLQRPGRTWNFWTVSAKRATSVNFPAKEMRNKKTIILQLKKGTDFIYYDIYAMTRALGSNAERVPICPPPSGVCGLTFASTFDQVKTQLYQ